MNDRAEQIRRTRDQEVARNERGAGRLAPVFSASVVGVTFVDGYPDNLYTLEQMHFDASSLGEPLVAVIRRNPDNAYDKNACEVHVPALGENGMVGHITRSLAGRLAAELDAGTHWAGEVEAIRISDNNPANPGLTIRLRRI